MQDEPNIGHGLHALTIYWSGTGNTEKVAKTIHNTLERQNITATTMKIEEAKEVELYEYDLVFLGAPSYMWLPPDPVQRFIKDKMRLHDNRGDIKLCAPKLPGKRAVVFCTYSGPHTGLREAIPVCKYMGQFFEHLGFDVMAEWYIVGEFHGREDRSTNGCLGDIRGRPNTEDLNKVENDVCRLISSFNANKQ